MKSISHPLLFSLLLSLLFSIPSILFGQSPQSIPYQAVVRNADGSVMSSTAMTMTLKIHDVTATGTIVYQESHSTTSNAQGLVILQVGQGQASVGTFDNINWGNGAKFLHVVMNTGNGEVDLGTQQMMSVPYALYAEKSGSSMPTGSAPGELMYWNGSGWSSIPPGTYAQTLVMCDGVPTWGGCLPKVGNPYVSITSSGPVVFKPENINPNLVGLRAPLISDGSAELLISGFIISTNQLNDPLTSDTVYANIGTLVDGSTDDNIISLWTEVSELLPSTIYYVKAFVQNQVGTAFSPVASFTTGVIVSGCFENQACNYNSSANQNDGSCLFVNNPCNDSNPSTIDDLVTEDCVCLGVPVVLGCMNPSACNYNNLADLEDGSCLIVGINCDDGNSLTSLDYVNANCQCEGLELQPQLIPEDGVNCLMDTIQFTQFSTSSVIQSIDQIQDVMVNLEHSYMGDLSIKLICPNQSSVFLHQQGGAGVGLGEPIDVDADTNPGIGYNYFWNPNATNGTWIENAIPPILPSGTYSSVENFSNLLGCPLNGLWVIQICDLWQGDNGYLFDWNIHLLGN